ncbi:Holliday junction branch migration protein RuvA [Paludisphaera rhizosphaerae]|uniref:Holliday junction branch migration protein RuvA n=1 Tax=Paludisphaera rhizosphaerae TaxID=2711216 RepID=UPI0013EC189A|nr:Holliday junction branch migration protein RuvA [Paludisphaera rhizosphaerae]
MITQIRGVLRAVGEESLTLGVDPFELEVLIPEHTRRQVQGKLGESVTLHTTFYIEGQAMGGRMNPRLIGFLSTVDREFFDTFCSVDGVGMRKALRAMVRPVREIARIIQEQDVKMLSTFPGIGEAMAERIVAKLRRKVGIFALIVNPDGTTSTPAATNGEAAHAEPDVVSDAYAALLAVGHSEMQARAMLDRALSGRKKFKSLSDLIEAIYQQEKS